MEPANTAAIHIIDFEPAYAAAFRELNEEWITRHFVLEEADIRSLGDPQRYVIDKGGFILMALYKGEPVGTCALLKEQDGIFELAKMTVTEKARGLKIGLALGEAAIAKAREAGAAKLFLVSNQKLGAALGLYRKLGFLEVPMPLSIYKRADIKMEILLK